jgi:hypothetical protein
MCRLGRTVVKEFDVTDPANHFTLLHCESYVTWRDELNLA